MKKVNVKHVRHKVELNDDFNLVEFWLVEDDSIFYDPFTQPDMFYDDDPLGRHLDDKLRRLEERKGIVGFRSDNTLSVGVGIFGETIVY